MSNNSEFRFKVFDKQNPLVWELFCKKVSEYVNAKRKKGVLIKDIRLSGWLVMNVIRWEVNVKTYDNFTDFKINNNYIAYYVRKFITKFPQFAHIFETRQLKK